MGCDPVYGQFMLCKPVTCSNTYNVQDSFYKPLTPEQSAAAFRNEFDFDAPEAIDFDSMDP